MNTVQQWWGHVSLKDLDQCLPSRCVLWTAPGKGCLSLQSSQWIHPSNTKQDFLVLSSSLLSTWEWPSVCDLNLFQWLSVWDLWPYILPGEESQSLKPRQLWEVDFPECIELFIHFLSQNPMNRHLCPDKCSCFWGGAWTQWMICGSNQHE